MRLASVVLARIYAVFPIEDLNPAGTVYYPDVVAWLVGRFGFQKYPAKFEDFDESKGIEFEAGKAGDVTVEKMVILANGVYVDTLASTDASETILRETLAAAGNELGIYYREDMLKRRAYVSQLAFYSDAPVFLLHPVFQKISSMVTKEVAENFGKPLQYQASAVGVSYDPTTTQVGPAPFNIQRREATPYSDNKYFSVAPVKTKVHLELLELLESVAKGSAS
jgi:hypothetical protein